jgi:hypothetical protein
VPLVFMSLQIKIEARNLTNINLLNNLNYKASHGRPLRECSNPGVTKTPGSKHGTFLEQ